MSNRPKSPNGSIGSSHPRTRSIEHVQPNAGSVRRIVLFGRDGFIGSVKRDPWLASTCGRHSIYPNQLCSCDVCSLVFLASSNTNRSHWLGLDDSYRYQDTQKQRTQGVKTMELATSQILGTIFYTIVIFGLGALSGKKIWYWVRNFFPWNRK